jgi:hypothetical protein
MYGTIGFWAEDAVESIHVIVNVLSRRYLALDKKTPCSSDHGSCWSQKGIADLTIGVEAGS